MADLLQIAGAQGAASDFAPLHNNRMVTGYWTNTNPLRDAATSMFTEKFYGGRQDRIAAGLNTEISAKLTLRRRPGLTVYNSQLFPQINRFYGWNTFTTTSESVRVMADTVGIVYDATGPSTKTAVWTKAPFAGPTFFLGVGNILYMTNGLENLQLNNVTGAVTNWGIKAPTLAPVISGGGGPGTAYWYYGYAYMNSHTTDLSNMSPQSVAVSGFGTGGSNDVIGNGSADPQVDTIVVYRTVAGGSIFYQVGTLPNPGAGTGNWTYPDTTPDNQLPIQLQAQVSGEGTPLPLGATCLEFHVGRIFAAVGNVIYVSSGPDAIVSGSSGMAGFDTTFTVQSKITRFWVTSLGLVVFTMRDAYIVLGSATPNDPLYVVKYIDNIPLLHYDAFATFLTTPYLLSGHKMINALDPSAGIIEASFPIADQIKALDPTRAFVTFHSGASGETALYVSDGASLWYRMAPTSAPESGLNWNPAAVIAGGFSALQSVEVLPGTMSLLLGPKFGTTGPILQRDPTVNTDNGTLYAATADIGNIVLASSGKLAGLAWIGLESEAQGTATSVAVLLDEIAEITGSDSARFYPVLRSRQDPPNLPPSASLYSNRHSLLQGQNPVWCKSLQLRFSWPAEDAANELLTFTIFGQTWAEQRSQ